MAPFSNAVTTRQPVFGSGCFRATAIAAGAPRPVSERRARFRVSLRTHAALNGLPPQKRHENNGLCKQDEFGGGGANARQDRNE
jgi:hypothetical protein